MIVSAALFNADPIIMVSVQGRGEAIRMELLSLKLRVARPAAPTWSVLWCPVVWSSEEETFVESSEEKWP